MEDRVRIKGPAIVVLTVLTGIYVGGCTYSSVLPPTSPGSAAPNGSTPRTTPLPDSRPQRPAPGRSSPDLTGNPWQPAAPPREWHSIVIHHTAAERGSVESIHRAHLQRTDADGNPWLGIGYHFVIGNGNGMPDGKIEPTFRWQDQIHGAHAGDDEHNEHGIGVALVGNFEEEPPTRAQLRSVKRLVRALQAAYGVPSGNVIGHNDVKATACPGRYFPLEEIRGNPPLGFGDRFLSRRHAVGLDRL